MALADAAVLGSQVDGVLMVFSVGRTRREMAHRAVAALQQANARVVGALLNRVPAKASGLRLLPLRLPLARWHVGTLACWHVGKRRPHGRHILAATG